MTVQGYHGQRKNRIVHPVSLTDLTIYIHSKSNLDRFFHKVHYRLQHLVTSSGPSVYGPQLSPDPAIYPAIPRDLLMRSDATPGLSSPQSQFQDFGKGDAGAVEASLAVYQAAWRPA